ETGRVGRRARQRGRLHHCTALRPARRFLSLRKGAKRRFAGAVQKAEGLTQGLIQELPGALPDDNRDVGDPRELSQLSRSVAQRLHGLGRGRHPQGDGKSPEPPSRLLLRELKAPGEGVPVVCQGLVDRPTKNLPWIRPPEEERRQTIPHRLLRMV